MATIVSSVLTKNILQPDGTRKITEAHTDSVGIVHTRSRIAGVGEDVDAAMAAYALTLPTTLAADEEANNYIALVNEGSLTNLTYDWTDPGDEVKLVCIVFMQVDIEAAIPLRPIVSGYTNAEIGAFFTTQERNRIQGHAGELLAIEAQITQWNDDKEVLLGVDVGVYVI